MQVVNKVKREPVLTEAACRRIHEVCDELLEQFIKANLGAVKPDLIVKNKKKKVNTIFRKQVHESNIEKEMEQLFDKREISSNMEHILSRPLYRGK